jgi:hypothetical protein
MESQCEAAIYKKDCLRIKRGYGFRMHYNKERCSRKSVKNGLCKQHLKMSEYMYIERVPNW